MRKFYLCGIIILFSSLLWGKAPFGIFEESRQEDYQSKRLWSYILSGRPITVDLELPASQEAKRGMWETNIRNSFNRWFTDTAKYVERSGRSSEFADVLPILKRGLVFGPNGFEVHVVVQDSLDEIRQGSRSHVAMASTDLNTQTIYLPTQEIANRDMTSANLSTAPLWSIIVPHEFGHMLGFIGQYPRENALHMDQVAKHSYSSQTYPQETVMSSASAKGKIGCDDTDAIINMIDLQRNGSQGARSGKTWASFCRGSSDEFRNGKRVHFESYQIRKNDQSKEWSINTGRGIKKYSVFKTLMGERNDWAFVNPQEIVTAKETVLKRDKENRPIKTKTNNGATVYYEYFQEVTRKAAFMGSKLAWVESVYRTNEYVHELEFLNSNYSPVVLQWSKPSSISYEEGRAKLHLSCRKNSTGKLACDTQKDELNRGDSWFGNFAKMNSSSMDYKIAKASAVNTLIAWFEQLPDKPLR